jgi:peptide/nickel transport system substrate-binding protein
VKFRAFRLRLHRRIKRQQHQVEDLGTLTEQQLEQNFFKRLNKFALVWRFVTAWVLLVVLILGCLVGQNQALSNYYQKLGPVPGGIYSEGIIGSFTNANPLYATSDVDATVARLVFSGLFKYDNDNKLVGDLAESWQVDDKGSTYTVKLRPDLKWQDGKPLTASDVAFTYHTIQNPDAQSPFNASWQNITVTAVDDRTVTFKLANALSSFVYTLTNGIVPAHILQDVPLSDLRSISFNTSRPIGAGPFAWDAIEVSGNTPETAEVRVALHPSAYYWNGAPKLKNYVVHSFANQRAMEDAYKRRDITAIAGLSSVPKSLGGDDTVVHDIRLNAATMVFFKTSSGVLSNVKVRQALVKGIDQAAVLRKLEYPTRPVKEPLLQGQVGYNPAYAQASFNFAQAKADLAADGWTAGPKGILHKDKQRLTFNLYTDDNPEYVTISNELARQWRQLGVEARVNVQPSSDFKNTLSYHTYDAVLHGISVGSDPDVFVYWDSSQMDIRSANRLNFSEYKSTTADTALQAGRSRQDPALRTIKYQPFLAAWQQDAPALGLYQPRYLYITHGEVYGLGDHSINAGIDRLSNVDQWMIRTARITNN